MFSKISIQINLLILNCNFLVLTWHNFLLLLLKYLKQLILYISSYNAECLKNVIQFEFKYNIHLKFVSVRILSMLIFRITKI